VSAAPTDARTMSDATPAADKPQASRRDAVERALAAAPFHSRGSATPGGRRLAYRVEGAFVPVLAGGLDERRGEPEAAVFTTAYLLERAPGDAAPRPVCFAFNGGPGASSIWLHLGALGPKRVRIGEDGTMPPPPWAVEDNPHTWLEHFDLVFIDPPHTGYSVTAGEDARKRMLSVDGDVACLVEAIRAWLARHARWTSPLYLAGESYGTTRGAAIADQLAEQGVALAGVILVSCAMDLQALEFTPRNDLPYALFLPAFAGVAQYHGCLQGPQAASGPAARALAAEFVEAEYLRLLHRGGTLAPDQRARAARRIGELTGLDPALVERHDLRITDDTFFTELLRARPGRRPARGARRRADAAQADRGLGLRPRPGGDPRPLRHGGDGLLRRDAGLRPRLALRADVPRRARAVELGPRQGARQRLLLHQPRPVAGAAPPAAPAPVRGERPLRPRHALDGDRLVARAARHPRRRPPAHHPPLLRRRAHDVHAGGRPRAAQGRPGRLAGRRHRLKEPSARAAARRGCHARGSLPPPPA
jgi:carboxypeptidase C (cathepsin A)